MKTKVIALVWGVFFLMALPCVLCADEVVYLFSTNGQQVLHTTEEQVNISFLPKGLYILRAITEDGQIHQSKIIHE